MLPKRPIGRATMLALGENLIARISKQKGGLARVLLDEPEQFMSDYMVQKGILLEVRVDNLIFLKIAPTPNSERN